MFEGLRRLLSHPCGTRGTCIIKRRRATRGARRTGRGTRLAAFSWAFTAFVQSGPLGRFGLRIFGLVARNTKVSIRRARFNSRSVSRGSTRGAMLDLRRTTRGSTRREYPVVPSEERHSTRGERIDSRSKARIEGLRLSARGLAGDS